MAKLRVGDTVMWKGSWGKDIAKEVIVTDMEYSTDGKIIKVMDWETVMSGREIIVSLNNGHWAYGFQLSKI